MKYLTALFAIILSSSCLAQEFSVPRLTSPVMDQGNLISPSLERRLNSALQKLHRSGGSQIAVATVSTLKGLPIENVSMKFVESWKLGKADTDKGVLLLLALKERRMRIEVGQGNEGRLTDVQSKRILSDIIEPLMKQKQYDDAILLGVASIVQATDPKFQFEQALGGGLPRRTVRKKRSWVVNLIYMALFLVFLGGGRGGMAGLFLGMALGGGGRRGGFGGGGGFSGGGGGFSGGGASGGW